MEQKELEPNFGRGGDLKSYFLSLTDGEHYTIEPKLTESLSESGMSGKQEFSQGNKNSAQKEQVR